MAKYNKYELEIVKGELNEIERKYIKKMLKNNIEIAFKGNLEFKVVNTVEGIKHFKIGTKIEGRIGRTFRMVQIKLK